jgi:hypothetical protein
MLIAGLNDQDSEVRRLAAYGLRKMSGRNVIEALYERLLIETSREVRVGIMYNYGLPTLGSRAFDLLCGILSSNEDNTIRAHAAWQLAAFGKKAEDALLTALDDLEGPKRAAAMSLGNIGSRRAIPALLRELRVAQGFTDTRSFEHAIYDATASSRPPGDMDAPSPELSESIRSLTEQAARTEEGGTEERVDALPGLPIHSAGSDRWFLTPAGEILRDSANHSGEVEEGDPLIRFSVMVHAAARYPELGALIPTAPRRLRVCRCLGSGRATTGRDESECAQCHGLGWLTYPE